MMRSFAFAAGLLLCIVQASAAQDRAAPIDFSAAEKAWLGAHPKIRVGVMDAWPPFDFVDDSGTPRGIGVDYIGALNRRLDGALEIVPGPWDKIFNDVKEGRLDAILDITPKPEREPFFNFTTPYLNVPHVIVAHDRGPYFQSEKDLEGWILALERGFGNVRYFRENYPKVQVREYDDTSAALDAVARGEADAYAGNRAVAIYLIEKEVQTNLTVHGRLKKSGSVLAVGVRKDRPVLHGILQKALDNVGEKERRAILREWTKLKKVAEFAPRIRLTDDDRAWLAKHKVIRLGVDPAFPPFEFVDRGGVYSGMASDYLKLMGKRLGVTFKVVAGLTWPQVVEGTKDGTVDVAPVMTHTKERREFLNFTQAYLNFPQVIVTRKEYPSIEGMKDLAGKTIAASKGYSDVEQTSRLYPTIKLTIVDNPLEELKAVATGKADATQGSLAVFSYLIEKHNFLNLRIAAPSDLEGGEMAMGVRKDWGELPRILDKALDSITETEHREIRNKWVSLAVKEEERPTVTLGDEEKAWLARHPSVRVMVGTWPPFHFVEDGKPKGLALEYVKIILGDLGLKAEFVPILWADALKGISNFEKVDLLPTIARSPEREKLVSITRDYLSFPSVIFSRKESSFIGSLKDLYGRTVAVERNFIGHKRLERDHPDIKLHIAVTSKDALEAVSLGRADAYLGNLATGSYIIERFGFANLKVAAPTEYANNIQAMGVRRDWPELAGMIDKSLAAITEEKHAKLRRNALAIRFETGVDIQTIVEWVIIGGGTVVAILFFVALWNRKLGQEISERKKAEDELAEKEAHLRTALDNMSDGIYVLDRDLNYVLYNDHYREMVRLPDGVIKPGAPVSDAIRAHAERGDYGSGDIGELVQKRLVNLADGDFVQAELRLSGGTTLDLRKAPLAEGGAVVISSDITERKKAEEELIAAKDEAEAATRAKDTFLATMSHEIRTPMNGVVGMIDLLRQTKLDGDQRQMMTTVRDSAYALLTIINDILDFSKIEAGKLDLEQIPVSIRDVVEGVGETLAPNSRAKGIRLLTYIDPNIPDAVLGDQVRLRQILFNIAGNAVKFTVEGKVTVRADLMPSGDDKSATVRFQVIDTGIGIPEEAQKNLFKEFSQAEASTTRRFGGTGLGLSICQRLTELMGGSITVASEPGEGSTFAVTVSLPVGPDDAIKSDGHDLSGVRVLAVLRDESARDQLSPYIAHWGADVVAEADIERAETLVTQAQAEGKAFQIVVLSSAWTLEQQEAVIQSIRGNADHSDIRFLLMSSSRTKADRKEIENTVYVDTDPLRRAPFIRAVAVAAGRASPEVTYDEDDLDLLRGEAVTVDEAAARGQLILVAEDNLTNQDVILRQLGLLGYAADMADDGQEALDALAEKSYAVLLTDCHMPNVDGFELTQTIRRNEEGGDTHLPVIAITASALEAEIERCFESGMDDFLAKPLEMNKLKEMLRKWMPSAAPSDVSEEVPTGPAAPDQAQAEDGDGGDGPIDPSALKSVFGDDEETFKEILNDFVAPATDNVAEIETAFANRSAKDVGAAAHKLKSSARAVGAHRLAELCLALEEAGKSENWADIEASAPQLQDVLGNVVEYIESL